MKPIIFSTPMVKAIIEGRKTQTRRVMNPQPVFESGNPGFFHWKDCQWADGGIGFPESAIEEYAPYKPGGILWVRETWICVGKCDENMEVRILYETGPVNHVQFTDRDRYNKCIKRMGKWRPPIFLQREAARLFLEVKSVRAERLRDISEEDAKAEGIEIHRIYERYCPPREQDCYRCMFRDYWNKLNAKRGYSWVSNPRVWVYEFMRAGDEGRG